jgi:hypothetical protein
MAEYTLVCVSCGEPFQALRLGLLDDTDTIEETA